MENQPQQIQPKEALTEYQKEGLGVLERVKETERLFQQGYDILSNLDQEEKRRLLADSIGQWKMKDVKPEQFEGSKLILLKKKELQEQYGVTFFPLSISVPTENWATYYIEDENNSPVYIDSKTYNTIAEAKTATVNGVKKITYADIKKGMGLEVISGSSMAGSGGTFLRTDMESQPKNNLTPFPMIGLAIFAEQSLKRSGVDAHEELHRVFSMLSSQVRAINQEVAKQGGVVNFESDLFKRYVASELLDEINAYRTSISGGDESWESVIETLSSPPYRFVTDLQMQRSDISSACYTVAHLEEIGLPQSAITHILLNCRTLEDLTGWHDITSDEIKEYLEKDENDF